MADTLVTIGYLLAAGGAVLGVWILFAKPWRQTPVAEEEDDEDRA